METNVLGIKIVRNLKGFTSLFEYNATPVLANSIDDLRDLLMNVENLTGNTVAIMLTNLQEGSIITVATWLAGIRGDESISAWIYVPGNIRITGDELASIIETTKAELISDHRNDRKLMEVFSARYEVDPIARPVYVTAGQTYARRFYGQDETSKLSSILDNLHQPYYKDYKQIFLLDYRAGLRFADAADLTAMKVLSRCLLTAPETVEGYNAFIDNQLIGAGKYFTEGDPVIVDWMRPGFQTIRVKYSAVAGMKCAAPPRSEMKFVCTYNHISVRNEDGEHVDNCRIMVNTVALMPNGNVLIHLDHIGKTRIDIIAHGYEDSSTVHDFYSGKPVITLKRRLFTYRFLFPTNNSYTRVELKSYKELTKSPFKGYALENRPQPDTDIHLKYSAFNGALKIRLAICALFFLIIGFAGGWFAGGYYNENVAPLDGIDEVSTSVVSDSTAVKDTTIKLDNVSDSVEVKKDVKQPEKSENKPQKESDSNKNTEENKK